MSATTRPLHIIISSYPLRGFLDLAAFVLTRSAQSPVMYKWNGYEALPQAIYTKYAFVD